MKKLILCLSAMLALLLIMTVYAGASISLSEEEAKALKTVSDPVICEGIGDCNTDGAVTIEDAREALRNSIGLSELNPIESGRADVDGDGKVTVNDAREILRIAIGLDEQGVHNTIEIVLIPATCSSKGYSIKYCLGCNKKLSEQTEFDENKHLGGWETVKEATCQNEGFKQYKCQLCGKVLEEKVTQKSGHKYNAWVYPDGKDCLTPSERYRTCMFCGYKQEDVLSPAGSHSMRTVHKVNATCTEDGIDETRCINCDYVQKTETVKAKGHLYNPFNIKEYKKATCTESGIKAELCVNCGQPRKGTEQTIPPLGHSYDYTKKRIQIEPTCYKEGKAKVSCTVCGEVIEYTLDKTEHTLTQDWTVVTPATCTDDGLRTAVCKYCKNISETIPAKGHSGSWEITKEATCKEAGLKTLVCPDCGNTETEAIAKLDHKYSSTIPGVYNKVIKEPTCVEKGICEKTCTVCGEKTTVALKVNPDAHPSSNEYRVVREATCEHKECRIHYCPACGKDIGYTYYVGQKAEHKFEWVETSKATCTKDGTKEYRCADCGTVKQTETITAPGHLDTKITKGSYSVEGVCKTTEVCNICGETVKESTFAKVVVKGGKLIFDENSTTAFKAGDTITFTVETDNADDVYAVCGIHTESVKESSGVYTYVIPEDATDEDIITFTIYTAYSET